MSDLDAASIRSRIDAVKVRVNAAARRAGRDPDSVRLVSVSKTVPVEALTVAYDAGVRVFGENRAQELAEKAAALPGDCEWHMIGAVQTNKVRMIAGVVTMWHTVDRVGLVDELARRAPGATVLVEVNIDSEPQKAGCSAAEIDELIRYARTSGLDVQGLMCVPSLDHDPQSSFARLARLAHDRGLPELSMGMTGDFEVAVEAGATVVRVGSAIFGPRPTIPDVRN